MSNAGGLGINAGGNAPKEVVKKEIKKNGFTLWQIAEQIGVSETSVIRWLRSERDCRNQQKVMNALNELKSKKGV